MAQEYKLKDISSVSLKNGEKAEYEIEGVKDVKVLLAKVDDEVHALSSKCTHFGAPMAKGVITGDGRITCPWHGACFKVSTGDVEDAPALDALTKFEIVERDGGVYVKSDEDTLKAQRRAPNVKCKATQSQEKVLIIGGGSGTLGVTEGLRTGGFKGAITVVSKEGHRPIDRTKLSKALIGDVEKLAWRSKGFYDDASIELVDDEISSIDFSAKKATAKSGKTFEYTKIVLASGGTARWLPLTGLKGDLGNVFLLRTVPDVQAILKAAGDKGKKVVVIGSSFIGMEVGNALVQKEHNVTVVGMEDVPLQRVMGDKIGKTFQSLLEKNGVKFYMGASVDKATPSNSDSSKVGAVHLKDGTVLEADLVIEGVGVAPATGYLKDNDAIQLNKDGSVTTDESFAVNGLKDVFAVGDIATYPYHGPGSNGDLVRIEHWNVAQNAGRSVARTINVPSSKPKPFIPVFWSALGGQLRYCGNTMASGFDDVVVHGNLDASAEGGASFAAYYAKGDTIVAVASMNKDPYMTQSAELMRRGKMPSKTALTDGQDILQISLPSEIRL